MIIYPAIDLKDGKVVRLIQGQFDAVTEYSTDPVEIAKQWVSQGAQWLHVIDLDGALTGASKNFESIQKIIQAVNVPVQVGGGIRTEENIERLINAGVKRAILGTRVIDNKETLNETIDKWGDKIAVSLDCSNGFVMLDGWTKKTDVDGLSLAKELESLGLKCIIFTDIKRDGMMSGPNFESIEELLNNVKIPVIASGGISSIEDIKQLASLESKGLAGAITGKAIYEGSLKLDEAIKLCSQSE